MQTTRVRTST